MDIGGANTKAAWLDREALRTLSADCREILDRFFCRDQSYHTIGELLDLELDCVVDYGSTGSWLSSTFSAGAAVLFLLANVFPVVGLEERELAGRGGPEPGRGETE